MRVVNVLRIKLLFFFVVFFFFAFHAYFEKSLTTFRINRTRQISCRRHGDGQEKLRTPNEFEEHFLATNVKIRWIQKMEKKQLLGRNSRIQNFHF